MKTGIEIITEERAAHFTREGWTPFHDDQHIGGELARAAACYAMPDDTRRWYNGKIIATLWPWFGCWWKPTPDNRIKELAKAGALIAAEIDRIQRIH